MSFDYTTNTHVKISIGLQGMFGIQFDFNCRIQITIRKIK